MLAIIRRFHRFLLSQSFYPLILASGLALAFFAWRVYYSKSSNFSMLVWNLFLAWIPYICSILAAAIRQRNPGKWWLLLLPGFVWLVFFPNAPYIVTDFYHLQRRYPMPLWYDIGLIAIFAFTGLFLAIASLRTMHRLVESYVGRFLGWIFAFFVLGLSGLGVYLGRFGRWNSWDMLVSPKTILKETASQMLNPLDNLGFVGFTLMFTAILVVFYLMFVSMNHAHEVDLHSQ